MSSKSTRRYLLREVHFHRSNQNQSLRPASRFTVSATRKASTLQRACLAINQSSLKKQPKSPKLLTLKYRTPFSQQNKDSTRLTAINRAKISTQNLNRGSRRPTPKLELKRSRSSFRLCERQKTSFTLRLFTALLTTSDKSLTTTVLTSSNGSRQAGISSTQALSTQVCFQLIRLRERQIS